MSWLDPLLALKTQQAGTTAGTRQTINFASGATVVDDPANDRVNVTITDTGITQLTGDVTAGPGSGSIAATVAKVNGVAVSGVPTAGQVIRATSGTASSWANVARGDITNTSGAAGDLITGNATTLGRLAIGSTGQVLTVSGGAPVWQQPGWFTAYEIDLTAQGSASYTADGTYTIGGQSWDLVGYGAGATVNLSAANGLMTQLTAASNRQVYFGPPKLTTLAGAGVMGRQVMIWSRVETTLSTAGEQHCDMSFYFQGGSTGITFAQYGIERYATGFGGNPNLSFVGRLAVNGTSVNSPNQRAMYSTSNTSHDVTVALFDSSDRINYYSGVWSGGWPAFDALTYRGYIAQNAAILGNGTTFAQLNDVKIYTDTFANASTNATVVSKLKALRIQTR